MKKILVTRSWPESVERELQKRFEVTFRNEPLSVEQWREALRHYDAVCPCVADSLGAAGIPPTSWAPWRQAPRWV